MNVRTADFIFWIAVVACLVAQLGIFRAEFFRPRRTESSPGQQLTHTSRAIEILWAIIPAVALAAILTATWLVLH